MEEVRCNLCNSNSTELLIVKNSFNIVRCSKCDLVYVNPRLTKEELKEIYSFSKNYYLDLSQNSIRQKEEIKKFRGYIKIVEKNKKSGRILEIGCALGLFLKVAQEKNWEVYGVEFSNDLAQFAREKFGLNIVTGEFEETEFPSDFLDVAVLWDVLEHMLNPLSTLKRIRKILRKDGYLFLTMPNINGFVPQTTYHLFGKTLGIWEHPSPPLHVYDLSDNTIKKMLNLADFEVIELKSQEIPVSYLVGEGIISKLIRNLKKITCPQTKNMEKSTSHGNRNMKWTNLELVKYLARMFIQRPFYLVLYWIARILKSGNSMFVIARKKGKIKILNKTN